MIRKTRKPLKRRRVPMFRGTAGIKRKSPLARGPGPKRSGRLRPRSAKARRQDPARRACREAVMARAGGRCEVPGCAREAAHVHERRLRSQGGSITDPANCLALCFDHHEQAHRERSAARTAGLILHRDDVRADDGRKGAA